MRLLSRFDFVAVGLWVAMWLVSFVVWEHVPAEVPTHWNINGEVDGMSSRSFGLTFVPLLATMVVGLMTLLVRAVWVKDSETVENAFRGIRRGVLALFAVLHMALVMAALGGAFDISRIVMTAVGIFLAYIALLLPKLPPNRLIGIRTKATLTDETSWKRAQRSGAWALALAGIATVLGAFLPPLGQLAILLLSVLAAATVTILVAARRPASQHDTVAEPELVE